MNRRVATLDPHRLGPKLALTQGNLIVTTTDVCDIHRSVFGTLAIGRGVVGFECYFWSTSDPAGGLVNLCSVGVAEVGSDVAKYAGEQTTSWGLRTSDGAGAGGIYNNNAVLTALPQYAERVAIGVLLNNDPIAPYVSWQVNGSYVGQATLPTGKFFVPAISIGSSASPGDVSAYLNFGQHPLDFPIMYIAQ